MSLDICDSRVNPFLCNRIFVDLYPGNIIKRKYSFRLQEMVYVSLVFLYNFKKGFEAWNQLDWAPRWITHLYYVLQAINAHLTHRDFKNRWTVRELHAWQVANCWSHTFIDKHHRRWSMINRVSNEFYYLIFFIYFTCIFYYGLNCSNWLRYNRRYDSIPMSWLFCFVLFFKVEAMSKSKL